MPQRFRPPITDKAYVVREVFALFCFNASHVVLALSRKRKSHGTDPRQRYHGGRLAKRAHPER